MNNFPEFLLSVLSSLIASIIFLFIILSYLRPKISISPYIIENPDYDDPHETAFCFKILNESKHSAFDIRLELCLLKKITVKTGKMDTRRTSLKLKRDYIAHVPKHQTDKKIRHFAKHAVIFRCTEKLKDLLADENNCVELQVSLRHGLTGLGKVFYAEFTQNAIRPGRFIFGNSLELES